MNRHLASEGHADRWPLWRPHSLRRHATRLYEYVRFEIVRTLRSRQYQLLAIALPVAFYLLYTQPGLGRPPDAVVDGGAWSTNAMARMATLGAVGTGLAAGGGRLAADRADGWVRTLSLASLPRVQVLAGRVIAGVVSAGLPVLVVIAAGVLVHGVTVATGNWIQLIISLWIGALPFALLGVMVGLSLSRGAALGAVVVLYFGLAVVGGLLEPIASMPAVIATIGRLLPSFLVRDLGWRAVLGQGPSAQHAALLAAESFGLATFAFWNRLRA
jgi:ABC-2 type transport system permease protein